MDETCVVTVPFGIRALVKETPKSRLVPRGSTSEYGMAMLTPDG